MLNLEKGQKHVSQVFDDWTDDLPNFGPVRMCSTCKFPFIAASGLCLLKLRLYPAQAVHSYTQDVSVTIHCSRVCHSANS